MVTHIHTENIHNSNTG